MKKSIFILSMISIFTANAQVFTQNAEDGSITITLKGLQGKSNSSTNNTNVALGSDALLLNTTGFFNTAIGSYALAANTTGYSILPMELMYFVLIDLLLFDYQHFTLKYWTFSCFGSSTRTR